MSVEIRVKKVDNKELQERILLKALKLLQKKTSSMMKEMRERQYFQKPSLKRHKKWQEAQRKRLNKQRKRNRR